MNPIIDHPETDMWRPWGMYNFIPLPGLGMPTTLQSTALTVTGYSGTSLATNETTKPLPKYQQLFSTI